MKPTIGRPRPPSFQGPSKFGWVVLVLLTLGMVGVAIAWNEYIYGDWRCVLAQCRIEVGK